MPKPTLPGHPVEPHFCDNAVPVQPARSAGACQQLRADFEAYLNGFSPNVPGYGRL
jgi:hypothetical protein